MILILLFPPFIVLIKPWYYRTGWLFYFELPRISR
nr:MAG TPA: hypothetical protein [Caudoviricetes sp.]